MKSRTSLFVIGIMVAMLAASLLTVLILFLTGSIVTNPVELVFTVNAVEAKEYDGKPLFATGYDWNSGRLKEGHHLEIRMRGSQTDYGTSESDLDVKVLDKDGRDVSREYSVKVNKGELTVTPKVISVVLEGQQIPYSGKEIPIETYKLYDGTVTQENFMDAVEGELPEGHKLVISFPGKFENVGDKLPDVNSWKRENFKIYNAAGNDVTFNYSFAKWGYEKMNGIEIVPRRLKVKVLDAEKYYDGKPLSPKCELISGSLVEGHYIDGERVVYATASDKKEFEVITVEDSTDVKVSEIAICKQVGYDLVPLNAEEQKNYILEGGAEVFGRLEIKQRPVTVKARDLVKIYDGNSLLSLIGEGEKIYTSDGLPEGFSLGNVNTGLEGIVNAYDGVYTLGDNVYVKYGEKDVGDQFALTAEPGIAKIIPIKINSPLTGFNMFYTGNEQQIDVAEALGDAFGENIETYIQENPGLNETVKNRLRQLKINGGDYFRAVYSGELKNADSYSFTLELNAQGVDLFESARNVEFQFSSALYKIAKISISVKYLNAEHAAVTRPYNGRGAADLDFRNLTTDRAEYEVSSAEFRYSENYTNPSIASRTPYSVRIGEIHIMKTATSEDVTKNFTINVPDVSVTITAKSCSLVLGQTFGTYECETEPTYDEAIEIGYTLSQSIRSSVSIQGLAAGDNAVYEEIDVAVSYDETERTLTFIVSIGAIRNSDGQDVTASYFVENDSEARSTIQIVVKGA